MALKDHMGKIVSGIIATVVVGIGVAATVLTGGLAAIGFLAVGAVASVGMMYVGANNDYKKEIGPEKYAERHGYTGLGLLKKWFGGKKYKDKKEDQPRFIQPEPKADIPHIKPLQSTEEGHKIAEELTFDPGHTYTPLEDKKASLGAHRRDQSEKKEEHKEKSKPKI